MAKRRRPKLPRRLRGKLGSRKPPPVFTGPPEPIPPEPTKPPPWFDPGKEPIDPEQPPYRHAARERRWV